MKYETPEMKILMLEAEDVITLSEGDNEDIPFPSKQQTTSLDEKF